MPWFTDLPDSVPDWDLRLAVRPPAGEKPGSIRLIADAGSFGLPRVRSLLQGYLDAA